MKKVIKLTENDLHNVIKMSVNKILEDMSTRHNGHNYDDYLDDNDFLEIAKRMREHFNKCNVTIEDFLDAEYREKLIDDVEDEINDFVSYEACDSFGYKYGELYGGARRAVAEHIIDFLEKEF